MIDKIRIRNYRKFRDVTIRAKPGLNIFVGDNESGKSTILEALTVALTGRINGRSAQEELNPFWFNQACISDFLVARSRGEPVAPPVLSIEVFLTDLDEYQDLVGAHNSDSPTRSCPGVEIAVEPDREYKEEIEAQLEASPSLLPVDFFRVTWRTFGDRTLTARPKELRTALIDSRTVRSTSSVDFHLRQMLSDHLEPRAKATVSVAYSAVKEKMAKDHLGAVNTKMSELQGSLHGESLSLGMDQSSRSSWDSSVVPYIAKIPFSMAGQGQQAVVKTVLSMEKSASHTRFVMIEEPENHLSHTNLNRLLNKVESLTSDEQQLFVTTHSSFVLNRLGFGGLLLVANGNVVEFDDVSKETVRYFQKLPGYDTLRIVLARRLVLVEGPSDEIVFERLFSDKCGKRPIEAEIDVVSMRGLSFRRGLELAHLLGKSCVVIRDNDGKDAAKLREPLEPFLNEGDRQMFIGADGCGKTLEPQLVYANGEDALRQVLGLAADRDVLTWMAANKTESAIRLAESKHSINPPSYLASAINFINGAR